jgi:hypothetical protein
MKRTTLLAALAVVVALVVAFLCISAAIAPDANADSNDDAYLSLLDAGHIENWDGVGAEIAGAHYICMLRAAGETEKQVIKEVYGLSQLNLRDSIYLVGAAEKIYCPSYWSGSTTV